MTVQDGQVIELQLENNQLVGTLPTSLCQLSHLEKLVVNANQLSGTLLACLGNLEQLDLHDNAFTSPLAAELIQTMVSNPQLIQLNLAHNQLGLPDCLGIQTLKQRGGWLDNSFIHSPQINGFNFDTDCPTFATLAITKLGDGRGTIKAKRSGDDWTLNCPTTCTQASESYGINSEIQVTATPAAGFQFDHWDGDCSGTKKTVTLHLDTDKTCQSYFSRDPNVVMHPLTINTIGQGTVKSQPLAGIDCQPQCQADYLPAQTVKLQAQPAPNHLFLGWSDACQGSNRQTTVVMNAAKTCTATFQAYNPTDQFTLTITKTGLDRSTSASYTIMA